MRAILALEDGRIFEGESFGASGTCVPQGGSPQTLDSLSDRIMFRLAYRNFGDHESLVVNHAVDVGGSVGVRWYEIQQTAGGPPRCESHCASSATVQ